MTAIDYSALGIKSPSSYQVAIFDQVNRAVDALLLSGTTKNSTVSNIMVQATAGAGKTSTIVAAANLIPASISTAFFAFGKKIATELQDRLPKHVDARTINSLGNGIFGMYVKQKYNRGWPVVDGNKVDKLIRERVKEISNRSNGKTELGFLFQDVKFLVSQAKANGVVPAGTKDAVDANGITDNDEFWYGTLAHFDRVIEDTRENPLGVREITDIAIDMAREVLRRNLANEMVIDFADQLYMAVVKRTAYGTVLPCRKFKVVMIDETQDLNTIQRVLVSRVLEPGGFLVAVGDIFQAIFGFAGADNDSMKKIQSQFNCEILSLPVSYRCARSIVEHAQQINPDMQFAPNAIEGKVEYLSGYSHEIFQPEDMVICRNNAPLISFAYELIKSQVRCKVLGRDIGAGLIALINKFNHQNKVSELSKELEAWYSHQVQMIQEANPDKDNSAEIQRVTDRFETINVFISETRSNSVDDLKAEIEAMFAEPKDATDKGFVILCTGHKAKGLECDNAYILDEFLMFPKWLKPGTWMYEQEEHVDFVCRTRAKVSLTYIESENFGKGKSA